MQPMDQMSMAVEYFAKNEPQSSGARYLSEQSSSIILKELLTSTLERYLKHATWPRDQHAAGSS